MATLLYGVKDSDDDIFAIMLSVARFCIKYSHLRKKKERKWRREESALFGEMASMST